MFVFENISIDSFIFFYRTEKETLKKIGKMLDNSSIFRRHRRIILNIHITFLAWAIEFFGFFLIFLGTFLLGHENNIVNFSLQTLTIVVYFNILPCVFLTNAPEFKNWATENPWYGKFLEVFNCQYTTDSNDDEPQSIVLDAELPNDEENQFDVDNQQPSTPNNQHRDASVDIENNGTH